MAKHLSKKILDKIKRNTGLAELSIRVLISGIKRDRAYLSTNAAAHIFAMKHGFSVLQQLDNDDRESLSKTGSYEVIKVATKNRSYSDGNSIKNKRMPKTLIYDTKDPREKKHIDEVIKAYRAECYTAVFMLCRKLIENRIIDVLLKRYPDSDRKNWNIYYSKKKGRFHDLSLLTDTLRAKKMDFPPSVIDAIDIVLDKTEPFIKDANKKTHSRYHIATKPEVKKIKLKEIAELVDDIKGAI